jgi:hypothetical protein
MIDLVWRARRTPNDWIPQHTLRPIRRGLPAAELLEPRQLLSSAGAFGPGITAQGKTNLEFGTLSNGSKSTGIVALSTPNSLRADAVVTPKPMPANRGASAGDAGDSLVSVTFWGMGFHAITSDVEADFPTYSTEQWLGGRDSHQWPVLYAASSTLTVSAEWTATQSTSVTGEILARATTSNGLTIPATPVRKEAGKLISPPVDLPHAARATAPFADDAQFYPHFIIHWQLSFDGGKTWTDAGQSDNPLYVSASTDPLPDALTREFYLTVVDSEINENLGLTAGKQSAIVSNTWKLFSGRAVRQFSLTAPFSDGTEHGRPLAYYGTLASTSDPTEQQLTMDGYTNNSTVRELLADGDAQCTAWARLFLDMLLVSGIVQKDDFVIVKPQDSNGFLVNNWNFIGAGTSGNPNYPYLDVPGKHYDVTKQPGVSGQNSPDPLSLFGNHVIALINGIYYDPSYGRTYRDFAQMTAEDVAGFVKIKSHETQSIEIQKRSATDELLREWESSTWKP